MADTSAQLQIVISAIDNASAQLQQIANNTNAALGQTTQVAQQTSSAFGNVIENVVAYKLAYEALGAVQNAVSDFFQGSIDAAIESSATMAQVKVDVDNAGLSYAAIGPQIDAVAEKNTTLGFTQDDTELSMAKLILATGNYNDALNLNQLAMDLARAKQLSLNDATVLIQQVMAGNTRALKTYGISLDSATTSGEALDMLQQKLQGSADAFANTTAGHMQEMQAQWQNLQVQVGNQFTPVIEFLFDEFEKNLPTIETDTLDVADALAKFGIAGIGAFDLISAGVESLYDLIQGVADSFADTFTSMIDGAKAAGDALKGHFSDAKNEMGQATTMSQDAGTAITDALNKVGNNINTVNNQFQGLSKTEQSIGQEQKDLSQKTASMSNTFDDIPNHIQAANNAMVKHSDAITALTSEYDKMQTSASTDLDALADDFNNKMSSIQDSIAKTQQDITDLTTNYNQQQTSDTADVANQIVASQQKIADLTTQISQTSDASTLQSLQQQLATEQSNYASSYAWRQANVAAMTTAEQLASETDLQRTINTESAKETAATTTYDAKLQQLKDQLTKEQEESVQEQALYQQKVAAINILEQQATANYKTQSQARIDQTTAEVQAEEKMYQQLASTISSIKGATTSAAISTFIGPVKSVNDAIITPGGIINTAPDDYLIATKTPGSLNGGGGSNNVVININGGQFTDPSSVRKLFNEMARQLNTKLKLRTV